MAKMAASDLVREGNEAFVDDDYEVAVRKYSEAIELNAYIADYYLKRSAAFMKLANYEAAAADASSAASLEPTNAKAHTRKGLALFHHEDFKAAREAFVEALEQDKENKELKTWIRKCDAEEDLAATEAKLGKNTTEKVIVGMASGQDPATEAMTQKDQHSATDSETKEEKTVSEEPSSASDVSTAECLPPETDSKDNEQNPENGEAALGAAASMAGSSAATASALIQEEPAPRAPTTKPRFDWYQTETQVIVTLMVKKAKQENVDVEFGEHTLSVTVRLPSGSDYSLELDLAHPVVVEQCRTRIMSSKIELKLKKAEGTRWSSLESDDIVHFAQFPSNEKAKAADGTSVHQYPSSRHVGKDWDKVAAQISKDEKDDKLEGEAALNQLFQSIYGDGNEEVRRAMNKSFVESGGTVLSTNWEEVGKETVDCKPPDGMEWKEWSK